jgi:hypothetical protein
MNRPSELGSLNGDGADSSAHDSAARRSTDQIDPYALIERRKLINTEPHDAVVFALRAQRRSRAHRRGVDGAHISSPARR